MNLTTEIQYVPVQFVMDRDNRKLKYFQNMMRSKYNHNRVKIYNGNLVVDINYDAGDQIIIGERIRSIRKFFSLDQRVFGERLDISWQTVSAMERETKKINADLLLKIEEVFGADSGWILNGRGNPFLPRF